MIVVLLATTLVPLAMRCEQDEPCWDCTVMGNRIGGPVLTEEPSR